MENQSLGRKILFGMNVATALNGLLADWNRTHLFNKNWPPHAKFHDGLSISLGLVLGGLGVYALTRKDGDRKDNTRLAALCPAAFFAAMISAQAYPGAESIETEFPDYWPKIGNFSFNKVPFAATMLALTALGWKLSEDNKPTAYHRALDGFTAPPLDVGPTASRPV